MIYIESTTNQQTITLPVPYGYTSGDAVRLLILSTVDLAQLEANPALLGGSFSQASFSSAFRIGEPSAVRVSADGRYITIDVRFYEAPVEGSWEYLLEQGGKALGHGCVRVGDYVADRAEYDKPIVYEQYQ